MSLKRGQPQFRLLFKKGKHSQTFTMLSAQKLVFLRFTLMSDICLVSSSWSSEYFSTTILRFTSWTLSYSMSLLASRGICVPRCQFSPVKLKLQGSSTEGSFSTTTWGTTFPWEPEHLQVNKFKYYLLLNYWSSLSNCVNRCCIWKLQVKIKINLKVIIAAP